jgi:Symplekin tight junction protein C terminal
MWGGIRNVLSQASGETMRVVTQALIRDTQTFHIDVLRDALDGLTSQDPLPRLAFRCLLLALETHNNTTVAVIVQTMLEKILLTRKPWADPETWRGVVILVKRLLPGSNRFVFVALYFECLLPLMGCNDGIAPGLCVVSLSPLYWRC